MNILAINGSSRDNSNTQTIIQTLTDLSSPDTTVTTFFPHNLPIFDQDLETNPPVSVVDFKNQIKHSDAIIFVTPEYNYSIPGVLKNAIDWASRPYGDNSWDNLPAAIISSSPGMLGGVRAQYHLRQMGIFLNLHFLNQPEVVITNITEKIQSGKITDQKTLDKISELLQALIIWTKRLRFD